ncbi:hypothetical protein K438DRAFT_1636041 [Mycena galopus ATCC 62051]|nr:hypothetical protein K438DRAFT_1636041 [Mycena galopus ATCC 62051]
MEVEGEDPDEGEDGPGAEEGKKHVCPTCAKRFNRPSSLRIHVNTHTGATPFRCPHPSCGRAFNVNSNMRRHFRNHASPAFSSAATPSHPPNSKNANWRGNSPTAPSPISPASAAFNSPLSPASSYASWSPASTTSSTSSSSSRYSPSTPLSPPARAHSWSSPSKGISAGGMYSESDVRSERR